MSTVPKSNWKIT